MIRLVIFGEDIESELIRNQAIAPFIRNNIKFEIVNIHKINKGRYDSRTRNVPIVFPMRLVFTPFIGAICFFYALYLSFFVRHNDVLIARSYVSGLVCRYISILRGVRYVFDTRSMFIHENRRNMSDGLARSLWMWYERQIARGAVRTAVVSLYQIEYFCRRGVANTYYMPCFYELGDLSTTLPDASIKAFNSDSAVVILYYGSLGVHWNDTDLYFRFFRKAGSLSFKIVILSQDYKRLKADPRLIKLKNVILLDPARHNKEEVFKACDYGVVLMNRNEDWQSRLSVKFVNYLGAGLRVIVNENVGEAVRILKNEFPDRGLLYSECDDLVLTKNDKVLGPEFWDKYLNLFGYGNFIKLLDGLI